MKSFLILLLAVLGLLVGIPLASKAQDFSVTFGGGPGYYGPGYYGYRYYNSDYCGPGNGYYYYHRRVYYPRYYYRNYYYRNYYRPHRYYDRW